MSTVLLQMILNGHNPEPREISAIQAHLAQLLKTPEVASIISDCLGDANSWISKLDTLSKRIVKLLAESLQDELLDMNWNAIDAAV